ncbi:MAG: TMEM175 family protein [Sphingobacteriales bacterium]
MSEKENYNLEVTTQRLEAFSDGVFAIAITLLILEIKLPNADTLKNQSLAHYLLNLWPKYFAYVFSFVIIGIYWANHHYLFKLFNRTDHGFNMLNVLFLLTIAFLPYPTAVFGEFIMEHEQQSPAVTFYAISIFLPAFFWLMIWLYASHKRKLLVPHLADSFIQFLTKQFIVTNILYFGAIIVSFFSPVASVMINVVLTLLYSLPPKKPIFN